MTMTLPHSHIGKTSPSRPLRKTAAVSFFGSIRDTRSEETKTSTKPEMSEPSSRNGTPSKRMLRKEKAKSLK